MYVELKIPNDASPELRSRLGYAFRLFCAIYGHRPLFEPAEAPKCELVIRYHGAAGGAPIANAPTVWLGRGYRCRDPREPAPPPVKYTCDGMSTLLYYAPEQGQTPDWLGEIFEWISCADEYSVKERDEVGRPLFEATYAGRHGIDGRTPYAALAMRGLQREICRVCPQAGEFPRAPQGVKGHIVIPTHDVDYFPQGRSHAASRLARNAVISCLLDKRPALGLHQACKALRVAFGSKIDPLDRIAGLAEEERRRGFSASYYFLVRHAHRHDARYSVSNNSVVATMRWLQARGMEIGLHGTFTSLDDAHGLKQERSALEARGFRTLGGRQHWLRFTLDRLLRAVEDAGLQYDSSIGWPRRIGYRAGACFAFPLYDFQKEAPAPFLELPLVVMDQTLHCIDGDEGQIFDEVAQLISTSRSLGWGGISLLWHPAAFGGGWLSTEVGEVFWKLADDGLRHDDMWLPASKFLELTRSRYVEAGLLPAAPPAFVPDEFPLAAAAGQRSIRSHSPGALTDEINA